MNSIDKPLWNVEDFFRGHMRDLALGTAVNELNPHFIALRFAKPTEPTSFIVSYSKKVYQSEAEARQDSVLMKENTDENILSDFDTLRTIRRKSFDNKFQDVFKLTQKTFDQGDPTLKDFKAHGLQFTKEALSNLLGGIGYYFGSVSIKTGNSHQYDGNLNGNKIIIL